MLTEALAWRITGPDPVRVRHRAGSGTVTGLNTAAAPRPRAASTVSKRRISGESPGNTEGVSTASVRHDGAEHGAVTRFGLRPVLRGPGRVSVVPVRRRRRRQLGAGLACPAGPRAEPGLLKCLLGGPSSAKLSKWPELGAASPPHTAARTTHGLARSPDTDIQPREHRTPPAGCFMLISPRYWATGLGLNPRTQPQITIGTFRRRGSAGPRGPPPAGRLRGPDSTQ